MKSFCNFILSFCGIFFLPLVFAHSNRDYTSYRRYPLCAPSDYMRYPKTTADVVSIVKEAITRGVKVKAFGSRHSQTDIICTEGIPIDMTRLNFCKMNADRVTATFGAGTLLSDAGEFLRRNRRALRSTPAYGGITLGGAIGTGAHGSTIKYNSTISSQVVKLTVVDGLGNVAEISDPADLRAFKVNLGLLGIIVDVTLYTVPLYKVHAHNYVTSDVVLTNGMAVKWAQSTDQITIYWFPEFNDVVVANLTFIPVESRGNARSNAIVPSTYDNFNLIGTRLGETAADLTSNECAAASTLGYTILHVMEFLLASSLWTQTMSYVPIYTEDGVYVQNPAIGFPQSMLSTTCSEDSNRFLGEACPWAHGHINANMTLLDSKFSLALSDLELFVKAVKDIVKKTPSAFTINGLHFRFSGKSDNYMSTSYGRNSVNVEFYRWKRVDPYNDASASLAGYQTILQTLARRFKGRSHWGKSGLIYHGREMLDSKLDPKARSDFVDAMKKFDPNQIFLNNFGRRLLKIGSKIDIDPLTTRCALLDNCFCSLDTDCGKGQICTTLPGYDDCYVCQAKHVAPVTKFNINQVAPFGAIDFLLRIAPFMVTSVMTECNSKKVI
ncbi:L-gulono-1,4-lactone dehydrogenase-like isoform X3 [Bradysia coprophila]|uniref:L-gulono-1,4-lactone dehydrogenase-like isoform X3 n=1 Tax=Bradysia coprophila TaxID=38358 RepID=UPI00187DAB84|nr:L-gulono-1,4-lactone dehydrogenase-like isoform X3 [Bradysia coprophila]